MPVFPGDKSGILENSPNGAPVKTQDFHDNNPMLGYNLRSLQNKDLGNGGYTQ